MGFSLSHILLVLVVALLVFGAGRLPTVMADLARGLKAFKNGLREEEEKTSISKKNSKSEGEA